MIREEFGRILRGAAVTALAFALVTGTAACGKKDETAAQTSAAQESPSTENEAEEPINPEEVKEEAKEEILQETKEDPEEEAKEEAKEETEESKEESKEETKEDVKEETEEKKDETAEEDKPQNTVIEKPGPSDEDLSSEQEEEKEEEKEDEEDTAKGLDLLDGTMKFDGMELQFPIELEGMTLGSWQLEYVNVDDPDSKTLAPGEVVTAVMTCSAYSADDVTVTAEFGNYSDSEAALSEIPMTGIYIEKGKGKDGSEPSLPEVEMPGGLTWGSTEKEIRSLFGEASLSGTFNKDFDCMYENGSYMVEFGGMNDTGVDYIVYCIE